MPEHTPAPTPNRAVYGFALYLSFKIFFYLYLVWAVVPDAYFRALGIDFLPQRHWAVTIPIFLLTVLTMTAFIFYPCLGGIMTPNVDDLRTITDEHGFKLTLSTDKEAKNVVLTSDCSCRNKEKCFKKQYKESELKIVNKCIPVLKDLNICDVSRDLYLK